MNELKNLTRRRLLTHLLAGAGLALGLPAWSADKAKDVAKDAAKNAAPMDHSGHDHSAHMAAAAKQQLKRSEANYKVAAVRMLDQDGNKALFNKELDDGRPVIINFIYTTCTAICPVMTQIFVGVQERLGKDEKVHMVSISIDPEYDTPKRLMAYAKEHGAGCQWDFYTGTLEASIAVQKSLDAYRGDKMNHTPLTLMRAAPGKPWVRLDGFASPDVIVKEFRSLVK